jgi:hypothetical protein
MTLMATRCPLYVPRNTLAKPPRPASTAPFEQSGMCMDFGITRCRLHVLQSMLSSFCRSQYEMVWSSRRCGSCWPWDGERREGRKTCLIHFINNPLDFGLRPPQKLEEGGDPWEEFSTLLWLCSNVWDLLAIDFLDPIAHHTWFVRFGVLELGVENT